MKTKKIILQERDYILLQYLYEMEYCSLRSLSCYVFKDNISKSTILVRLFKLKSNGLLGAFKTDNYYVYFLKRKAIELLRIKNPNVSYSLKSRQLSLATIDHTVLLSEIRAVIEKRLEIKSFISEKTLRVNEKNQKKYIPDGIIYLNNEVKVLELERTLKSDYRIEQRIKELRDLFSQISEETRARVSALIVCNSDIIKRKYDNSLYSSYFSTILMSDLL